MPTDGSAWPPKLNRVMLTLGEPGAGPPGHAGNPVGRPVEQARPQPVRRGGQDGQLVGDEGELAARGGGVAGLDLALLPGEVPGAVAERRVPVRERPRVLGLRDDDGLAELA